MNFKRVLALVLVFAMCLSMIPTYAFADFDEEYGLIDEADPAAQNETVPEGDVYIDEDGTEEPAVEPVVEPVAEEPAEPEKEQVLDLGELGDGDEATFNADPVAKGTSGEYLTMALAVSQKQDDSVNLLTDVTESFTIDRAFTILGLSHTITGKVTINAPAGAVVDLRAVKIEGSIELNSGELLINSNDVTVTGDISVYGGKLSINQGTYFSATAYADTGVEGNVTGGTFTDHISNYLCKFSIC